MISCEHSSGRGSTKDSQAWLSFPRFSSQKYLQVLGNGLWSFKKKKLLFHAILFAHDKYTFAITGIEATNDP